MKFSKDFCLLFFIFLPVLTCSQWNLSGTVLDEKKLPIPFANVYVKNNTDLRTQTDENGKFSLQLFDGEYFVIVSATGYTEREVYVIIANREAIKEIQLFPIRINELEEAEISVKRTNPGREIMLEVVKKRDQISQWSHPHTTDVYIKATESIARKEKEKETDTKNNQQQLSDPFEEEQRKMVQLAGNMNISEIQLTRSYAPPNKVKEVRNAYELKGNDKALYYTTTIKSNFNFFQNLLYLEDLHSTPVMSPISTPGILSYRYRLEAQYEENGRKIHKIKILPRMSSTSTLTGYIYVIDSLWLIQKLDLTMEKGNLFIYDYFSIHQEFDLPGDSMCVLREQVLDYGVKYKTQTSTCKTLAQFSNYNFKPVYPAKFFNNEVAVTTEKAYERDSTFWKEQRAVALTTEEQRFILVRDSIHDVLNRKEYLDSVDHVFNRVTFLKIIWFGVEHRNRPKKVQWSINSLAATARPLYPAGPRVAPGFNYFKKWKDQRTLDMYTEISYGFLNHDIKGSTNWDYLYNPFKQAHFKTEFSHEFDAIVSYDAITQIYKRSNFIEATKLKLGQTQEYFNGLYVDLTFEFCERRSINGYKKMGFLDNIIPNDDFKPFQGYQALLGDITITYTPGQKYMREPHRKVVLGSKWPSVYAYYQRGIPKLLGSDVDHEYGLLGIYQNFQLRTLGTSSYHIRSGKFLSAKSLKEADFKYQRRSDPIWFSNPLYSFQDQDSSLPSKDYYIEAHFIHHDNGSIMNKIPFMKKTGIGLVFGCGALYVAEYNWKHYEVLAGIERNFKFSKRRLRIGLYGVFSDGNHISPHWTGKISFAVLDDRNMKFNF
ncbi:DUF5686 and carboxypeptidase regulatory-like domain-containing protein [Fluviicola sp.]|jgi:hypothetical protein|uniref:DUF5686 and carboxypeptidase regulatory-like domain-containing protein n=1 Tax=Fluviicola sp. TaxID=1917219 RepID=UPI002833377B|nr:DUF5686 and carboxypeptidase regulatory-like domain-containing protein [Fluviicola sp.]MDR0802074.1 DUF5686 and carboxypeptidase regulatory-like domain-containing protein [Fluviicola sp.]